MSQDKQQQQTIQLKVKTTLSILLSLLTSWIELNRVQSKLISSRARSQVFIPKILIDLCCDSSFSAKGFYTDRQKQKDLQ